MFLPLFLVSKVFVRSALDKLDNILLEFLPTHIGDGIFIDDIIRMASTQYLKKIDTTFAIATGKECEQIIADTCAKTVFTFVPLAGVIDLSVRRYSKSGLEEVILLTVKIAVVFCQNVTVTLKFPTIIDSFERHLY